MSDAELHSKVQSATESVCIFFTFFASFDLFFFCAFLAFSFASFAF